MKLLYGKAKLQNDALKVVVLAHYERGLIKGALVRQFEYLYDNDIIEEEGFMLWESDVHDQTPGRQKALLQVRSVQNNIFLGLIFFLRNWKSYHARDDTVVYFYFFLHRVFQNCGMYWGLYFRLIALKLGKIIRSIP